MYYVPEMIRPHKPLMTDRAYKIFFSRVCPSVSGQFIRSSKAFATAEPRTRKGSFACKKEENILIFG